MAKILILNTGGTIGMRETDDGLQPEAGFLHKLMDEMSELRRGEMPGFDIIEYDPLLDSSNLTPDDWLTLANDIAGNYEKYDGFVILHGTDTMAYTASGLAFMLEGLGKPVVLTGAQLPLGQIRNDARENLKTAMMLAANPVIQEVGIFFGEVLLRGCRSTKASALKLDAFESPNYPPLGSAETHIEVHERRLRSNASPGGTVKVHEISSNDVATFQLYPGMSTEILRNLLQRPLRALILQSYGVGNGPSNDEKFLDAIREAVSAGTVILNITQCHHGCVAPTSYATGTAMTQAGVVSGRDMTTEAAIAKCMFLLSQNLSPADVRGQLEQDLRGEVTLS